MPLISEPGNLPKLRELIRRADTTALGPVGKRVVPKALYHLQDDPREDSNVINKPKVKDVVDRIFREYLEIDDSAGPTVPNR